MTKTDDEIIEELGIMNDITKDECVAFVREALSLKQNQQDELFNKFEEKVDEFKIFIDKVEPMELVGVKEMRNLDKKYNQGLEKSKQLLKEVFTKTKEE